MSIPQAEAQEQTRLGTGCRGRHGTAAQWGLSDLQQKLYTKTAEMRKQANVSPTTAAAPEGAEAVG